MGTIILHKATVVTAEKEAVGTVIVTGDRISRVIYSDEADYDRLVFQFIRENPDAEVTDLQGKYLMAGGIDAHVHFREPGLTRKADISTESKAALAGGVTSVMDMPNTSPATISGSALAEKYRLAENRSYVNIGFHIGATNTNSSEIEAILDNRTQTDPGTVAGVKVFMGSSTGNMLVDDNSAISDVFSIRSKPVLVHCEDENTILENLKKAKAQYGDAIPFSEHEHIRSRRACIKSSIKALEKAIEKGTRLVLCHISTKEELEMARAAKSNNPGIIAETSCNYLWFCNEDYRRLGSHLKCNPSVKTAADRQALREGLASGIIDTIGSDHAPHLLSEKDAGYLSAPSGLPTIQQSLPLLITIAGQEEIPLTRIAAVFSENASDLYGLERGKILPGYYADIVIFDKEREFTVRNSDQYSKCGWTPYDGELLKGYIERVLINGHTVLKDGKIIEQDRYGRPLESGRISDRR
jgi:dihydroorotase